jgi:hypothetical protein
MADVKANVLQDACTGIVMVFLIIASLSGPAVAQNIGTSLTFIPGSSVKVEQIIGDQDYQTKAATASQSTTRFNIHPLNLESVHGRQDAFGVQHFQVNTFAISNRGGAS